MKLNYLNAIIMICLLILVSGCQSQEDENVVEDINEVGDNSSSVVIIENTVTGEDSEIADSEEADDSEVSEDDQTGGTSADLVEELMQDLVSDDTGTEEEEETVSEDQEIIIEYFRGDPKDLTIEQGATVKFTNNMPNFKHVMQVRKKKDDGTYEHPITVGVILEGESAEYTFDETGTFQWLSATNYPITSGRITVVG